MNGSIKDLLKIPGVHGYVIAKGKNIQIKLPSRHRFAASKDRIRLLYEEAMGDSRRPGNMVEIYTEDMVLTMYFSGDVMLMVISSRRTNLALLRMTGKLVLANMIKEKGK